MSIVKEIQHGNVKLSLDDTYCKEQTNEEAKEVLERVSALIYRAMKEKEKDCNQDSSKTE